MKARALLLALLAFAPAPTPRPTMPPPEPPEEKPSFSTIVLSTVLVGKDEAGMATVRHVRVTLEIEEGSPFAPAPSVVEDLRVELVRHVAYPTEDRSRLFRVEETGAASVDYASNATAEPSPAPTPGGPR